MIDDLIIEIENDLLNDKEINIDNIKNKINDKDKFKKLCKEKEQKYHNIQSAYKILMNSLYGYFGTSGSRFFRPEIAEAVTITGQEESYRVQQVLIDNGYVILYGDTDSVFILVDKIPITIKNDINKSKEWILNEFVPKINELSDNELKNIAKEIGIKNPEFGINFHFKFKQEIIAKSGIFLPGIGKDKAKKRYDLYVIDIEGVEKNEIISAGTPLKQSKLPDIVKKYFEKFIDELLNKKNNNKNILINIIKELKNKLIESCDKWDIAFYGSYNQFSKPLEKYPTTNTQSQFAKVWNQKYAKIFGIVEYQIKVKYKFIEVKIKPVFKDNEFFNSLSNKEKKYIKELYNWCKLNKITMVGIVDEENDKFLNLLKLIFDIDKDRIIEKYVYNIFKPYLMVLNIPIESIIYNLEDINIYL